MNRFLQSEAARRYREEARTDPVEHALRALAALGAQDLHRLTDRYNSVFMNCTPAVGLAFSGLPKKVSPQ